ncbi:MAG: trigger factor [Alphaproteobacteria bacterium]|nr:trigger factor [Alphaproteobacteria bacterium]
MADVKVLKEEGLKHEFSITISQSSLEDAKGNRLAEIAKTVKLQGFRPGKVPLPVVAQRFGSEAYAEALEKSVSKTIDDLLTERKLRPATQPKVEFKSSDEGKDVSFTIAFDSLPDIKLIDFGTLALERPIAAVEDAKIEETLVTLTKRMRQPEKVEEKRGAEMGDVVIVDFDGSVDGEKRPGMKGEDHPLELGSKSFIDTFEDQLVGTKVGEEKSIKVTFPKDYHASDLAGKEAVFEVSVKEIRQHKPVVLDEALAKELGFPNLEGLRSRIAKDIQADYDRISRTVIKRALMDKLAEAYSFDIPQTLSDAEFESIWHQLEHAKEHNELSDEDKNKDEDTLRKEYRAIADRRIRLGLVLAEVSAQNNIQVTADELRSALMAEARRYPGQEKAVFDYYTKTQGAIERLRAPLLEEKVVDFILDKASVTDKKLSPDELMAQPDAE